MIKYLVAMVHFSSFVLLKFTVADLLPVSAGACKSMEQVMKEVVRRPGEESTRAAVVAKRRLVAGGESSRDRLVREQAKQIRRLEQEKVNLESVVSKLEKKGQSDMMEVLKKEDHLLEEKIVNVGLKEKIQALEKINSSLVCELEGLKRPKSPVVSSEELREDLDLVMKSVTLANQLVAMTTNRDKFREKLANITEEKALLEGELKKSDITIKAKDSKLSRQEHQAKELLGIMGMQEENSAKKSSEIAKLKSKVAGMKDECMAAKKLAESIKLKNKVTKLLDEKGVTVKVKDEKFVKSYSRPSKQCEVSDERVVDRRRVFYASPTSKDSQLCVIVKPD